MEVDLEMQSPLDAECLMPIERWLEGVVTRFFTDYDGYGHWATKKRVDRTTIVHPSDVMSAEPNKPDTTKVPQWATHICWYNR